jgi:methylthioribose-1-phosphate isomerase
MSEENIGILPIKVEGDKILLLDQRHLPHKVDYVLANDLSSMCLAIKDMTVRGAPSIGVAAGFGIAKEALLLATQSLSLNDFLVGLNAARFALQKTRPTAVNIQWATDKIYNLAFTLTKNSHDQTEIARRLFQEAEAILLLHIEANRTLSEYGQSLIKNGQSILTHCNAGSLATCGWGTALGVIRSAHFAGRKINVYVDETRPRNQGSRLTMWELSQDGIDCTLIPDSVAGFLMAKGKINFVITGADRIAANGDTANKVGTYSVARLAFCHGIPFYIAAPMSTVDPLTKSGEDIEIEERDNDELTTCGGISLTIDNAKALNLAFDVTPAAYITGIITEYGILMPPYEESIQQALMLEKSNPIKAALTRV